MTTAAEQAAKRRIARRDSGVFASPTCQWPDTCWLSATDAAHVLPKGRYPELRAEDKNLISLCRNHHSISEHRESRIALLMHLARLHGYDYSVAPYSDYVETDTR